MKCEVDNCIYQRKGKCIVDTIQTNQLGMCDDCIIVSIEEEFLEEAKRRQFENIERRWAEANKK